MYRISTNLPNVDMQYYLRQRQFQLNQQQNRIAGQSRIIDPRDDPLAAAHSTRYRSYLTRLRRFSDNIEYAQSNWRVAEGYLRETVDILQRVRELAIQGANGIYSDEERGFMATEVNELLNEIVEVANARAADGTTLFSGSRTHLEPFRALYGTVAGRQQIIDVEYLGNIEQRFAEISEGSYVDLNVPGNQIFWAENQQIFASVNAEGYQVDADTTITIDDVPIELRAGDTIGTIIAKINDSAAPVRARLDPASGALTLETTVPHQIWLSESGTVLQELGIRGDGTADPPHNIAESAERFGGSLFDMVIGMRDALEDNDVAAIGGGGLAGIDRALDNLLGELGGLGARDARLQVVYNRIERYDEPNIAAQNSRLVDPDLSEEILNLRILEQTHQAALSTAGRILPPTLLDFLR